MSVSCKSQAWLGHKQAHLNTALLKFGQIKHMTVNATSGQWGLFCMNCAGKPPFDGANMQLLYKNIASGKYKAIPSTYSKEMSNLITKMLKKNPNERPNAQNILDN